MKYKIVEIHPDDAYFESGRDVMVGVVVEPVIFDPDTKLPEDVKIGDEFWSHGSWKYLGRKNLKWMLDGEEVVYKKNEDFFFYKVKIKAIE